MSTATLMTAEQFAQMHTAETEDYELVDGELIPLPSGTPLHSLTRDHLVFLLWGYFKSNPGGRAIAETDCQLSNNIVRRPDLSIFLGEHSTHIDLRKTPIPFAPDIAIEILSPSESAIDVSRKALDYLAAGCQEVWAVDHENHEITIRTTSGIRLISNADRLETPLLPGFSQAVTDLLAW